MSLKLNTASGGSITLQEADTASNLTITVPAVTGTMLTNKTAGTVLQVVSATTTTRVNTNSTSFVQVGASASITPSSSSNKIAVFVSSNSFTNNASGHQSFYTLYRNSTNLGNATQGFGWLVGTTAAMASSVAISYVDSPSTTSSTTYSLYGRTSNSASTVEFGGSDGIVHSIVLMEIAA